MQQSRTSYRIAIGAYVGGRERGNKRRGQSSNDDDGDEPPKTQNTKHYHGAARRKKLFRFALSFLLLLLLLVCECWSLHFKLSCFCVTCSRPVRQAPAPQKGLMCSPSSFFHIPLASIIYKIQQQTNPPKKTPKSTARSPPPPPPPPPPLTQTLSTHSTKLPNSLRRHYPSRQKNPKNQQTPDHYHSQTQ